jgi:hypothetical protein
MLGGAMAWLAFNVLYFAVVPWVLARYVPAARVGRFYAVDTTPFAMAALAGAGALWALARWLPQPAWWACVAAVGLGYGAFALMCYSSLRQMGLRVRALLRPAA